MTFLQQTDNVRCKACH